jgi:hypothetical protein
MRRVKRHLGFVAVRRDHFRASAQTSNHDDEYGRKSDEDSLHPGRSLNRFGRLWTRREITVQEKPDEGKIIFR